MKQNQNIRRSRQSNKASGPHNRNKNNGKGRQSRHQQNAGNAATRQVDSHGPAGKVRGTAKQLYEKYKTVARENQGSDSLLAEALYQHADHYYRIYAEYAAAEAAAEAAREKERQRKAEEAAEHQATLSGMDRGPADPAPAAPMSAAPMSSGRASSGPGLDDGMPSPASARKSRKSAGRPAKKASGDGRQQMAGTPPADALVLDLGLQESRPEGPKEKPKEDPAPPATTKPAAPQVEGVKKRRGRPPKAKPAAETQTETTEPKQAMRRPRKKMDAGGETASESTSAEHPASE